MTELASDEILRVDRLQTHFELGTRVAKSVDGVSFSVRRGQTVAVVGESGSGKSVTSLSVMGLLSRPGRIIGGKILYRTRSEHVVDLASLPQRTLRAMRGREIAMIFQEPMTSLNPLYTVGQQIDEMIKLHEPLGSADRRARVKQMLDLVEIPDAARRIDEYPHQMSGGMRQRVMIALALSCNPSLLIADEPTTALDVTIQAQILDLLRRLQGELGMSILFITHNLGVVAEIAHDVVVMYAGRVVEQAPVDTLFAHPKHPYTQGLLACMPDARRHRTESGVPLALQPIPGTVPNVTDLPDGCSFSPRCRFAQPNCAVNPGPDLLVSGPNRFSRCWYHETL
ncbi:Dipeptide transport ATP-binding protein DppD [Paraburkholderia nemoris]|uniref:ABC transporter ATP-binding protein n=1 Tax=Paraburkholderia nemoris TaxID=2793076 RepID=UPI00190986D6|nr:MULTISPECIES: ABC transporter ATP-binding protein [Paraburkholderia]MBK3786562.1 ABC transporter ATP-binding protein [Paraburkholderia aspalathi]CAE6857764.1 Dipeptide transport ATP-binding protein DppD [Paraburkholderia nemoris]